MVETGARVARRPWPRRVIRGLIRGLARVALRLLVTLLVLFLVLTVASVVYNAATKPAATFPAPDGADVSVDGVRVHFREW